MLGRARVRFRLVAAALLVSGCSAGDEPVVTESHLENARLATQMLDKRLKSRLMDVMAQDGPQAAVAVCANEAPQIAAQVFRHTGVVVSRTAMRVRSPANQPDAWAQRAFARFEDALASGAQVATLEETDVVVHEDGSASLRYARPILLQAPCLTCHGGSIAPALLTDIRALYPGDTATGFAIGDLRGMFLASAPLSSSP
ncbi:MAG: DUF3365 domain-containing protein [Pseudomonadota bacterium]